MNLNTFEKYKKTAKEVGCRLYKSDRIIIINNEKNMLFIVKSKKNKIKTCWATITILYKERDIALSVYSLSNKGEEK